MRVAQFLSASIANGAARHCFVVSEALARRGHEVTLFHRAALDVSAMQAAGVRCVATEFRREWREFRRIKRALDADRAQVVHTHMSGAHAYGVLLRFMGGPPTVATAHAQHLQLHWAFNALVLALNEAGARFHRRVNLVPGRRMRVIPGLIGAQRFNPATPERRAAARAELGLDADALVIGQAAEIHFEKRQADLMAAVRELAPRRPNLVVALKGSRPDPGELRRLMRAAEGAEGLLRLYPRGDDVGRFFDALDIFVISSQREQGPIVAVEAMSAALPIVSTRVGRMAELSEGGEAASIVPPRDVSAMAEAIDRLAGDADLRRRMGERARRRALAELDVGAAIDRIEAALADVAEGRVR